MKATIDFESLELKELGGELIGMLKATVIHLASDYPEYVEIEDARPMAIAHVMLEDPGAGNDNAVWYSACHEIADNTISDKHPDAPPSTRCYKCRELFMSDQVWRVAI